MPVVARVALLLIALSVFVSGPVGPNAGNQRAVAANQTSAESQTATMAAESANRVVTTGLARAPELTAEQRAEREAALAASHRSGPTDLPYADLTVAPGSPGPEAASIAASAAKRLAARAAAAAPAAAPAAPGDFVMTDNIVDPGIGANPSFVQEPSSDNAGANIFQSGNWYATRSFDGGATWEYVNPSMFGAGFCCDQVVLYDAGRNRWFWLLQFSDHLVLANSGDLLGWCYYNWTPASFGFAGALDYNDLAFSTNYIYITSNIFPNAGGMGSTIARLPIDPQIACGGFNYNYFTSTAYGFTWKPVSGAYDVMYWGTNWAGTLGSFFRVFKWAENGAIFVYDRNISAYGFYVRNSGQNCGSANGVVKNWCQFSDSRVLGGARYTDTDGTARLVFAWNAKQGPPYGLPFPFIERAYFREGDIAYLGSDRLWADWTSFQFPSLATDARGHVGMTSIFGGGTGGGYYPSGAVMIQDEISPSQPWQVAFPALGTGNTCTYGGLYRYGDYMTTRPLRPTGLSWVGSYYVIAGADCGAPESVNEPHQTQFGRMRDVPGAVQRWT